jgi:hypothetical protein
MTQDEIIEMARLCGFERLGHDDCDLVCYPEEVEAFAKLVAAKEREACAKLVEELPAPDEYSITDKSMWDVTCIDCADAIRARDKYETK